MELLKLIDYMAFLNEFRSIVVCENESIELQIESVLAGHLITLSHAVLETIISDAVSRKMRSATSENMHTFAETMAKHVTGKVGLASLKDTLTKIDKDMKNNFRILLSVDDLENAWHSLTSSRELVAHRGQPVNQSLSDLVGLVPKWVRVVKAFCQALELDPLDCGKILKGHEQIEASAIKCCRIWN